MSARRRANNPRFQSREGNIPVVSLVGSCYVHNTSRPLSREIVSQFRSEFYFSQNSLFTFVIVVSVSVWHQNSVRKIQCSSVFCSDGYDSSSYGS